MPQSEATRRIVQACYDGISRGDISPLLEAMADDIVFDLPANPYNRIVPYLGTHHGKQAVLDAFGLRERTTQTLEYHADEIVADGRVAFVSLYTKARQTDTGIEFEVRDIHRHELDEAGKIHRIWICFDPTAEIAAFRGDLSQRMIEAVSARDAARVAHLLDLGASANASVPGSGLPVLSLAAARGDVETVRRLLARGADPNRIDRVAGVSPLLKACQGGSLESVKLLVEAGAFVDLQSTTTGHTALLEAIWFNQPDIVAYLLEKDARLEPLTYYGFSLKQHLEYEERVAAGRGFSEGFGRIRALVEQRRARDGEAAGHALLAAVVGGGLEAAKAAIAAGTDLEVRHPVVGGFNDGHTALIIASRNGGLEIVEALLEAGADVNAIEPVFGAAPLHKATYNGWLEITRALASAPGVHLDYQGPSNGYTALHDALWHGYPDCAGVLIDAGARLDVVALDGKRPVDIAMEQLGAGHPLVARLRLE